MEAQTNSLPKLRLTTGNDVPFRAEGDYVLYWMTAFRRPFWNFALQRAVELANNYKKPLVVLEPLRVRYKWASDRMHRFVIEGMQDNANAFAVHPVTYFPYVEPQPGVGTPLLHLLAKNACTVVTDDFPCFFLPTLIKAVKDKIPARLEIVDSNGLVPLRFAERTFTVAHSYRRWMQKHIATFLAELPEQDPLDGVDIPKLDKLPSAILRRWPIADFERLLAPGGLKQINIDHRVKPAPIAGGVAAANIALNNFLENRLTSYNTDRNEPDLSGSTGLSPYLHFGHISPHQIVHEILVFENWKPSKLGNAEGKNSGFWNTSVSAEGLLDQLLTWRELGFNMAHRNPDTYAKYESLPDWAKSTLFEHRNDPRPHLYTLDQFEAAKTHDELWNAAQRQLVREGTIHNYMRMLWGKNILHWSRTPQDALEIMIHLNNKYALDGRDPNSYSGIFWTLGRFDRAWGPKRPVFGSIRYMTSESARKKLKLKQYLKRFGADELFQDP